MADESKGTALVILGIVAIIAIIGLVLLYSGGGATGKVSGARSIEEFQAWKQNLEQQGRQKQHLSEASAYNTELHERG